MTLVFLCPICDFFCLLSYSLIKDISLYMLVGAQIPKKYDKAQCYSVQVIDVDVLQVDTGELECSGQLPPATCRLLHIILE